jgi:hypothetical protein
MLELTPAPAERLTPKRKAGAFSMQPFASCRELKPTKLFSFRYLDLVTCLLAIWQVLRTTSACWLTPLTT